jgi:hypothetical protein
VAIDARYAAEIAADFATLEREARTTCPRAWELSELLDKTLRDLRIGHPAVKALGDLQLHMIRAMDDRKDVGPNVGRVVRLAVGLARDPEKTKGSAS